MNPSSLTLREWFEAFAPLFLADARPRTLEAYEGTVAVWERVTSDPPLATVDQLVAAKFRTDCPGRATTVAKHCRHLNALFAKLGPSGPRNRDALGLLEQIPWFKPPRTERRTPTVPLDEQVERFVTNASPRFALFSVLAATTGSRQTAIRSLTGEAIDLAASVVRFPAETDKRRVERLKPLPSVTIAWWTELGGLAETWPRSRSGFGSAWRREAKRVGTPSLRPHGFKRWWAATLIRNGASPWCVRYALDHAQKDVTGIHYLAPFDELSTLVTTIKLPDSFNKRLEECRTPTRTPAPA